MFIVSNNLTMKPWGYYLVTFKDYLVHYKPIEHLCVYIILKALSV